MDFLCEFEGMDLAALGVTFFCFVACALTELKKESTFELSCSGSLSFFSSADRGGDGG